MASGTRARKASGPASTGKPSKSSVRILPPARSEASSTVTEARSRRNQAVARPAMPAPTTTTRGRLTVARSRSGLGLARYEPVDQLDQPCEHVRVGLGQYPVAQVEDVAGAAGAAVEPPQPRPLDHRPRGQAQGRVEVPLHGLAGAD